MGIDSREPNKYLLWSHILSYWKVARPRLAPSASDLHIAKNLPQADFFFLWTYGESNPDLFHAMELFYRYTMGPSEKQNENNTFSFFLNDGHI